MHVYLPRRGGESDALGQWWQKQVRKLQLGESGGLEEDQVEQMNALLTEHESTSREAQWERFFAEVLSFTHLQGCLPGQGGEADTLGQWWQKQVRKLKAHESGGLDEDQVARIILLPRLPVP